MHLMLTRDINMIVKENIAQFKRGQKSKRALDVGIKRKGNLKDFIERGLEAELGQFTPKYALVRDEDRSKHWVNYNEKDWIGEKSIDIWANFEDFRNNREWLNIFKDKVRNWIKENTDFKIEKFQKSRKYNKFWVLLDDGS